jgi:hypothetical protein
LNDVLFQIIMGEIVVALAITIILLILLVWWLLRKLVVVPTITVTTDKTSYYKGETVQITGSLKSNSNPITNETVALAITPPTGDIFSLPNVTTNADGNFASSWVVPADAAAGSYVLTATALGVSATKTFTLIEPPTV